LYPLLFLS